MARTGKAVFLYSDWNVSAVISTSDASAIDTDVTDLVYDNEATNWAPATTANSKTHTVDRAVTTNFDVFALLGRSIDGIFVGFVYSNDNFVANASYQGTNEITDPDFSNSSPGWTIASGSAWSFPSSGGASADGTQTTDDALPTTDAIVSGKTYLISVKVSGSPSSQSDSLYLQCGTNQGEGITTDGYHTQIITSNGTEFSLVAGGASGGGWSGTIDYVHVEELSAISAVFNAAWIDLTNVQTARYVQVVFGGLDSTTIFSYYNFYELEEMPSMVMDDPDSMQAEGSQLLSSSSTYLGAQRLYAMRELPISWPPLDVSQPSSLTEYNKIVAWAESCIRDLKPFFFIPESDDETVCYFAWCNAGQKFSASRKNKDTDIRTVSTLRAMTRIA